MVVLLSLYSSIGYSTPSQLCQRHRNTELILLNPFLHWATEKSLAVNNSEVRTFLRSKLSARNNSSIYRQKRPPHRCFRSNRQLPKKPLNCLKCGTWYSDIFVYINLTVMVLKDSAAVVPEFMVSWSYLLCQRLNACCCFVLSFSLLRVDRDRREGVQISKQSTQNLWPKK